MQGQQPVIRQSDQQTILQQPAGIVIKMNEPIQQITPVGKLKIFIFSLFRIGQTDTI